MKSGGRVISSSLNPNSPKVTADRRTDTSPTVGRPEDEHPPLLPRHRALLQALGQAEFQFGHYAVTQHVLHEDRRRRYHSGTLKVGRGKVLTFL